MFVFGQQSAFEDLAAVQEALALYHLFGRQIERHRLMLKPMMLVRAIAKRLVGGKPAAAQGKEGAAAQVVGLSFRVNDFNFALQSERAVLQYSEFYFFHVFLILGKTNLFSKWWLLP